MLPSKVDKVNFRGKEFYVKRDDLIDSCLSGNKYRKLYILLQTPSSKYSKIISYGGSQSNAMYAISCLCKQKGWEFHYYTKNLPQFLKDGAEGNLDLSLKNKMIIHELKHEDYKDKVDTLLKIDESEILVISQGAADEIAQEGLSLLADEITKWKDEHKIDTLKVVVPSGTGTTALYLSKAVDENIKVYTSILVGDEDYQVQQWNKLSKPPYPNIFKNKKKYKFAKPYDEFYEVHKELLESTKINFDLIYAPQTWIQMYETFKDTKEVVLYIHTGGVSGNVTMLERYKYKAQRKRSS
ncbi:1-aminocyclopropane-1-carboxylate deaminase [Sulfurimonas sp. MAG313]|nr:1-aminocyclopropane-1-carboxylate deaminase [Sulfurimonas sp. MAG313]MDF1879923.1 1-aminocyclopropane-1-carboxylate deaminase [Sulfurimonas sp. MAG313]